MNAQTLSDLVAIREILGKPGAWIQDRYARDAAGNPLTNGYDEGACKWCLLGAIEHVTGRGNTDRYWAARDAIRLSLHDYPIPLWNDEEERTQADVIKLLDNTIKANE